MLDIVIGLVLVYLLLSLITTSVREELAGIWKTRARFLKDGIEELLGNGTEHGSPLVAAFYQHPRIYALYRKGEKNPSYIPARSFSSALLDMAARGTDATSASQAGSDAVALTPENIRRYVAGLGNPKVQRMVLCAVDSANGDLAAARQELEDWFDSAMDRVSGRYRRRTQWVVFLIALVTTTFLNVDTIEIATAFYRSPALREAAVAMAGRVTPSQGSSASPSAGSNASQQPGPSGLIQSNSALDTLYALQLPIGWVGDAAKKFGRDPITTVLGWVITALAVSLGAPFWFDTLNRIMVIRSTVKPREKSPEEGSEDRRPNVAPTTRSPSGGQGAGSTVIVAPVTPSANGAKFGEPREVPHEWNVGDPLGGVI